MSRRHHIQKRSFWSFEAIGIFREMIRSLENLFGIKSCCVSNRLIAQVNVLNSNPEFVNLQPGQGYSHTPKPSTVI